MEITEPLASSAVIFGACNNGNNRALGQIGEKTSKSAQSSAYENEVS
jgi:hypothetical protein